MGVVLAMIGRLPQPLKTLYLLFFAAFAASFLSVVLGGERAATVTMGVLGAVAALTGLTIATNLNGSVQGLTEAMTSYRPLGVDYSRSVFATRWFTRLFGFLMLAVGLLFVVVAVSQLQD
ncbi:MAG TPA: hypothetical protein VI357_23915 [Mycobacteriales bacterium]